MKKDLLGSDAFFSYINIYTWDQKGAPYHYASVMNQLKEGIYTYYFN